MGLSILSVCIYRKQFIIFVALQTKRTTLNYETT